MRKWISRAGVQRYTIERSQMFYDRECLLPEAEVALIERIQELGTLASKYLEDVYAASNAGPNVTVETPTWLNVLVEEVQHDVAQSGSADEAASKSLWKRLRGLTGS